MCRAKFSIGKKKQKLGDFTKRVSHFYEKLDSAIVDKNLIN